VYEWSGQNPLVGLFVAVNESTWEHIKLIIFPSLLLMIIEYPFFKKYPNFIVGSFISLLMMILLIPILFYGYQFITGKDVFILDILDFIISIIIGQLVFNKIMKSKDSSNICQLSSLIGLIIIIICYFVFTYFPPKIFIFQDPITNKYGIEGHSNK
jgi:hypothetical protein